MNYISYLGKVSKNQLGYNVFADLGREHDCGKEEGDACQGCAENEGCGGEECGRNLSSYEKEQLH